MLCFTPYPIFLTAIEICPSGWLISPASRSCIKVHHTRKRWNDARSQCKADGGDMLTYYDKEKEKLIFGIILLNT